MGVNYSFYINRPEHVPESDSKPTFDPQEGFAKKRKARVMVATEDEMRAAKLPLDRRDYCAHFLINFESCRRTYYPFTVMCAPEKHQYHQCEYEDYVMRMKEFEREKRLRERKMGIKAA